MTPISYRISALIAIGRLHKVGALFLCILVRYVMGAYFNRRFVHHRSMGKKEEIRKNGMETEQRDSRGRFVKGNKGGTGRPKTPKELKEALERISPKAIEFYEWVLDDPDAPVDLKAKVSKDVLDRLMGKPQQSVAFDDVDNRIRITIGDGAEKYAD